MAGLQVPGSRLPPPTPNLSQGQQIGASVPQLTPNGPWQQTQWNLNTPPTQTPPAAGPTPGGGNMYALPGGGTNIATAGGGGGGSAPPPMDQNSILDILKGLTQQETPAPPAREQAPTPTAQPPSQSLAFARAKDQSGRVGNAALRALKDQMSERGLGDSGIEAQLSAGILGDVGRSQSDAAFQQQMMAENQGWQAAQQGYQGGISQRGQDVGLQQSGLSNATALAPTVLRMLSGVRY